MAVLRVVVIAMVVLAMGGVAAAQDDGDPIEVGTYRTIESEVLGETRQLLIALPSGYEAREDRYPVLYLLDGDAHFMHTVALLQFKEGLQEAPPMIVVAVANTRRTRDMTPPVLTDFEAPEGAGGADAFLQFFSDELIPFIDSKYRTLPYRVLVGHSFGGLFAVHALVHRPEVFDATIAISPSLWWDEQTLVGQAEEAFRAAESMDHSLYVTLGNEGGDMRGGVLKFNAALVEHAPQGLRWKLHVMDEETHGTVPYRSTLQGIEFIFESWIIRDVLAIYDASGVEGLIERYRRSGELLRTERSMPPMALMMLAYELIESKRLDEARSVIEFDPDTFPPMAMIYLELGKAHEEQGEPDVAIDLFTKALKLDPSSHEVRAALEKRDVDPDTIVARVELTAEQMEALTGRYLLEATEQAFMIRKDGNQLVFSHPVYGEFPMSARSSDEFSAANGMVTITFQRDDSGAVTGLSLKTPEGEVFEIPKGD